MNHTDRIAALRSKLLPAGTELKDVPPDWRGLSLWEWEELRRLEVVEQLRYWQPAIPSCAETSIEKRKGNSDGQQRLW